MMTQGISESDYTADLFSMVQPIGEAQQQQVVEMTEKYVRQAESIFDRRFARVPVLFDLKGRTAGMLKIIGRQRLIRYNPWIFGKYYEEKCLFISYGGDHIRSPRI